MGGRWSRELCGGTHVQHSSQIGLVTLTTESSVGSGVRRVEAFVGIEAFRYLAAERTLVHGLTEALKVQPDQLTDRVQRLVAQLKDAERQIAELRSREVLAAAGTPSRRAGTRCGACSTSATPRPASPGTTCARSPSRCATGVADRPAVVAVVGGSADKPSVVVVTTEGARQPSALPPATSSAWRARPSADAAAASPTSPRAAAATAARCRTRSSPSSTRSATPSSPREPRSTRTLTRAGT